MFYGLLCTSVHSGQLYCASSQSVCHSQAYYSLSHYTEPVKTRPLNTKLQVKTQYLKLLKVYVLLSWESNPQPPTLNADTHTEPLRQFFEVGNHIEILNQF